MNREIKFRAWDIKNNCFSEEPFFRLLLTNNNKVYNSENDEYTKNGEKYHICQYTGLKDKNGKEIYEGDILLCHEYDSSDLVGKIIQTFKNAVVGFENGSFYYYPKGNMKQPHQLLMYAYKPEIIGNIYENPELLNT